MHSFYDYMELGGSYMPKKKRGGSNDYSGTYSGGVYYQVGGDVDEAQYGGIQLRDVEYPGYAGNIMDILPYLAKAKHGGIHINPAKKGTFTAAASKHGMGVQEFASQVLANKDNYSPAMVKKANFARNASKWKHEEGGDVLPAFQNAGQFPSGNEGTQMSLPQGSNPFEWSSFNEQPQTTISGNYGSGDQSINDMFAANNPTYTTPQAQPNTGIGPSYKIDAVDQQYNNDPAFAKKYDDGLMIYHMNNRSNPDSKKYIKWYNNKYPQPKQTLGQKMSQFSDVMTPTINLASNIADFFVQNSRQKQQRLNGYMKGMTDQMWYNKPAELSGNRGDYVATGSMFGELRPDERVVNKGMYTGKFYPQRQFAIGGDIIPDELSMPMPLLTADNEAGEKAYSATGNTAVSPKMELNTNFKEYADKANAYLQRVKPDTDLTGEMLAGAAQRAMQKYGTTVPVEMALAQAQLEGYLANGSKPNRPQRTKNPFNVGNTDDGSNVVHKSLESGVQSYYDLMARNYLSKRTPDDLLQNFVNSNGNRYASDKTYESKLKSIITGIQQTINAKHKYQKGGEHMDQDAVYDLTEDQIRSIIAAGGDVEFV